VTAKPRDDDVIDYLRELSNWGRWGKDDRLGTFNLITEDVRVQAAGLVRDGTAVSLAFDIDPAHPDVLGRGTVVQRFMQLNEVEALYGQPARFDAVREYVGLIPHGSLTHLDALAHFSWDGQNYNGFPASAVRSVAGSTQLSVHQIDKGFFTRGVLLDVAATLGVPWLDPGRAITPEEIAATQKREGVTVRPGDALFVRTGNFARIAAEGAHPEGHIAGLSAANLPFLRERDIALLCSDGGHEVIPAESSNPDLAMPIHAVGIVALGLWLIDNAALDELARTCEQKNRWEFLVCVQPWRFVGVTSSAVNPVAIF
jgi:kynurenine formamidase